MCFFVISRVHPVGLLASHCVLIENLKNTCSVCCSEVNMSYLEKKTQPNEQLGMFSSINFVEWNILSLVGLCFVEGEYQIADNSESRTGLKEEIKMIMQVLFLTKFLIVSHIAPKHIAANDLEICRKNSISVHFWIMCIVKILSEFWQKQYNCNPLNFEVKS